jgi:PAS domain S-box-containing protein
LNHDATLQLVLETALDAVIVMRTDGTVAEWNEEAARVFGWNRNEVLDRMLGELIVPAQHQQAHRAGLARYLACGEGPVLRRRIEITGQTRDGRQIPIELSITPVSTPHELLFLAFVRDISGARAAFAAVERKALEASLLHRVASHAAESDSLDETITLALDAICELLDWPVGHAYLVRPESESLHSHVWVGDVSTFQALVEATARAGFTPGVGLPGRVWTSRQPQWVEQIDGSETFLRGTAAELNIRAAFAIPILSDGRVVAVLEFFSPEPHPADADLILTARTVGEQLGRALERQQVREQQSLMMGELEHRTKNMIALISSLAAQTARGAGSVEEYARTLGDRLASLGATYGLLTQTHWQPTPLKTLIEDVVGPHLSHTSPQLRLTGDFLAPARAALSLSMILHELTTNAVKYGALSKDGGAIDVDISTAPSEHGPTVSIQWTESGVGTCAKPEKAGFGSRLIERLARNDLGGTLQADYPPSGATYRLRFPLPA